MDRTKKILITLAFCAGSTALFAAFFSLIGIAADNRALAAGAIITAAVAAMIVLIVKEKPLIGGIVLSGAIIGCLAGISAIDDLRTLSAEKARAESPQDALKHPSARIIFLNTGILKDEYARRVQTYTRKSRKAGPAGAGFALFVPLVDDSWTPDRPVAVYVSTPASADRARDLAYLRDTKLALVEGPGDRHHGQEQAREAAAAHGLNLAKDFRVFATSRDPLGNAWSSLWFNMVMTGIFLAVQCVVAVRFALKGSE